MSAMPAGSLLIEENNQSKYMYGRVRGKLRPCHRFRASSMRLRLECFLHGLCSSEGLQMWRRA